MTRGSNSDDSASENDTPNYREQALEAETEAEREAEEAPPVRRTSPRRLPESPLSRELGSLRAAVNAVMDNQRAQSQLLETIVRTLEETNQEMRATLEVQERVIAAGDDQLEKLTDVTDALIRVTTAMYEMYQGSQRQ